MAGCRFEHTEEGLTAYLSGEIDHHAAKLLREQIDPELLACPARLLTLDFGQVEFMDSSGVGLILGRYRLQQQLGGRLAVRCRDPRLLRLLQLSGLEEILTVEKGVAKA